MSGREIEKRDRLNAALRALHGCFSITAPQMLDIAEKFHEAMLCGLVGRKGPLKMIPSFFGMPTGEESGVFLSVDFGGTNVRVSLIKLLGHGKINVLKSYQHFGIPATVTIIPPPLPVELICFHSVSNSASGRRHGSPGLPFLSH